MPRKPRESPGAALSRALLARYDVDPHEALLLREAAHTADACAALQAVVDRDGPMVDGKVHPGLVELRMQRLTLGRLLAGLWIPVDGDERLQARPTRGFYKPKAVS
jgi:hypothetical protein